MPFKSKAQQRKMFAMADEGEISKGKVMEWAHKTPNIKKLPEKVRTKKADLDEMLRRSSAATGRNILMPAGTLAGALMGGRYGPAPLRGGLVGGALGAIGGGLLGNMIGESVGQSRFESIQQQMADEAMRRQLVEQGWAKGASMYKKSEGEGAGVLQAMKAQQSQESHEQDMRHNEEMHALKMQMEQTKLDKMQQPAEGEGMLQEEPAPPPPPPELQPGQAEAIQQAMAGRPRAEMPMMAEKEGAWTKAAKFEGPHVTEKKMKKKASQIANEVLRRHYR